MSLKPEIALHFLIMALILFGSGNNKTFSQAANFPTGAAVAGVGGASVSRSDTWSTFNNPAMVARAERFSAGVNYENRFLVKELGISSISAVMPVWTGAFGLAFNQFGTNLYSQTFTALAYGQNFGKHFNAGVRLDMRHTRLSEDYGKRTDMSFALGFGSNITEDLVLAAALFNPLRVKSAEDFDETLAAIYRFGLGYRVEKNLSFSLDVEKDVRYKPSLRTGVEYVFKDVAAARIGIGTNPLNFAFGFGFNFGSFIFDIAAVRHEVLGYSPQGSLIYISKR